MTGTIVYLAIPYTHPDPKVRDARAAFADYIAARLFREGNSVYSPISSWHHIAVKHELPKEFDAWKDMDEDLLSKCDTLLIVTIPGWQTSKGVQAEMNFASACGIRITYYKPTDEELKMLEVA